MGIEWLKAILYGILEGITEWLPVSSTGHLILLEGWIPFAFTAQADYLDEFGEIFQVVIQLGAILAVVFLFRHRLFVFRGEHPLERKKKYRLWGRVLLASVPAALVGLLADTLLETLTGHDLDGWLYRPTVVACTLILYGVCFLFAYRDKHVCACDAERISARQGVGLGFFQVLSLIPGTSRSGSVMLGGACMGLDPTSVTEFSFFMAVPVMLGASLVKGVGFASYLAESGQGILPMSLPLLVLGCAVSFAVSLTVIRFLMDFVKKHGLTAFGIYRILLGTGVLLYVAFGS